MILTNVGNYEEKVNYYYYHGIKIEGLKFVGTKIWAAEARVR